MKLWVANGQHTKRVVKDEDIARSVSSKLDEVDVKGAVRLTVSDDTLASYDAATVAVRRYKHPSRSALLINSLQSLLESDLLILISEEESIVEAIKTFLSGSDGGLDGLCSHITYRFSKT